MGVMSGRDADAKAIKTNTENLNEGQHASRNCILIMV